jgi:hypothetical protein
VIALAPWTGLDVDAGLRLTAYLIVLGPLFAVASMRVVLGSADQAGPGWNALWLIVIYAAIWTLVQLPMLPDAWVEGGGLRQPAVRSVAQILMFTLSLAPLWIVPMLIRNRLDLYRTGRIYIVSCVVLCALGWLQLAIWYVTGSDPFPIGFVNELLGGRGEIASGIFVHEGALVYRMSSFGGEPKGLGAGLAVALLLLQADMRLAGRAQTWLWPLLFVSLLATFSTMAILGWLAASLVQVFVSPRFGITIPPLGQLVDRALKWGWRLLPIVLILVLIGGGAQIFDLIEFRTTGRLATRDGGVVEEFNAAVLGFLTSQPLWAVVGTGLGNAHLYADPFLPAYSLRYAAGTVFVAKSALLRWISEIGLITFLMFAYWAWSRIGGSIRNAHRTPTYSRYAAVCARFAVPMVALWLVSGYITPQFYLMIGACIALGQIVARERLIAASAATGGPLATYSGGAPA